MLKLLFGGKKATPEVVIESDRARFSRLVNELNEVIDTLAHKPRVTIDPATGHIEPDVPEQFPDEALALPAPATESEPTAEATSDVEEKAEKPQTPELDAAAKAH
ncbi:hypothetical protein KUL25_07860 [Rhodobacteraceae bacterium N5(2021)]|uniref:Uncharacterized protein n=1 Tax=Gymnodinialimonas phycosphaerae TaxID=2841589 RepID=A0A975TXK8_9RHOB|nr:hypothetical protein [Gymnodinialimonas phycosphaerae]MBY4892677.1 hypothetical protein [Gymnodinialimonas phycosphaerae]